jgi:hypothetical protein
MAFSDIDYLAIVGELGKMFDHHRGFQECPLTHDDFMRLVIAEADYDIVKRARDMFDSYSLYGSAHAAFSVRVDERDNVALDLIQIAPVSFFVPKYAKKLAASAPPELIDVLVGYVRERLDLSRQYGRVREVLRQLATSCDSPAQVRFLFPAISLIVERITDEAQRTRLHRKLSSNSRKLLPPVPPGLRAACRESATTIAMWQMLPTDAPAQRPGSVDVRVTSVQYADDLGAYYGM